MMIQDSSRDDVMIQDSSVVIMDSMVVVGIRYDSI